MLTVTRRLEWDAAHRIPRHESKCAALHGHRYVAELTATAPELDDRGRIIDFGVVKAIVGTWIDDNWDHTALFARTDDDPAVKAVAASNEAKGRPVYWLDAPPTAENIAAELARIAGELLAPSGVTLTRIRIWETPNCSADWTPS